jgi:peptide-methionine (S)-S-oxide reductase
VSYAQLTAVYWHNVDPTDGGGQFCDRGHGYISAAFYEGEAEHGIAAGTWHGVAADHPAWEVATALEPRSAFWAAEAYHQVRARPAPPPRGGGGGGLRGGPQYYAVEPFSF